MEDKADSRDTDADGTHLWGQKEREVGGRSGIPLAPILPPSMQVHPQSKIIPVSWAVVAGMGVNFRNWNRERDVSSRGRNLSKVNEKGEMLSYSSY